MHSESRGSVSGGQVLLVENLIKVHFSLKVAFEGCLSFLVYGFL